MGPFFAVDVHERGTALAPPWRRLSELREPVVLDARVQAVRTALAASAGREPADVELRVAASVAQLGLVARLVAPAVGAAALGIGSVSLTPDDVWWQDRLGGPFPLSVPAEPRETTALDGTAIEAITVAVGRYRVSERVLWGNVASAANSAARLIGTARPDLSDAARAAADAILADPRVEGGELRPGPAFRRRSCCLIYRVAGDTSAVCGDCVLQQ